jgi:hypothetical protein
MKLIRIDFFFFSLILLITIVAVFDLFTNTGRSANMDGLIHTTTIAMFGDAMRQGDFPVRWVDGFGNYGFPVGIIAHQLPTYLGAFINYVVQSPVLAFNIVCFIGLLLSNLFFYLFLRLYFNPYASFAGTFLFNFAPYRIINLYIRGAIPEAFSNIFLPLVLIGIFYFIKRKKISGLFLTTISIAGMALTHPMTLVIFSFIFVPYALYIVHEETGYSLKKYLSKVNLKYILALGMGGMIAMGIAAFYVLVINLEIKYFYYGSSSNHLTPNQYMGLKNFFDPNWYYFAEREIFPRGHFIQSGLIETLIVISGLAFIIINWARARKIRFGILEFAVFLSLLIAFFTTKYSDIFYSNINLLSNIQFPWRMFSSFMFLPPIIMAFFFNKFDKKILILVFILLIAIARFPQLYGKNYAFYPLDFYLFTPLNLHSTAMNTVWSGRTEDYPIKKNKPEIIEGNGKIVESEVRNTSREYKILADTPLKMVDYTFYFPGWNVYVNGAPTPIEFQDPKFRGVITYSVPSGENNVNVKFEDTKVRSLGKIISGVSLILFLILFALRNRIGRLLYK